MQAIQLHSVSSHVRPGAWLLKCSVVSRLHAMLARACTAEAFSDYCATDLFCRSPLRQKWPVGWAVGKGPIGFWGNLKLRQACKKAFYMCRPVWSGAASTCMNAGTVTITMKYCNCKEFFACCSQYHVEHTPYMLQVSILYFVDWLYLRVPVAQSQSKIFEILRRPNFRLLLSDSTLLICSLSLRVSKKRCLETTSRSVDVLA